MVRDLKSGDQIRFIQQLDSSYQILTMSLQNFENQIEPGLSILVEILEPQDQVVAGQQIVQLELLALANIKQLKKSHG